MHIYIYIHTRKFTCARTQDTAKSCSTQDGHGLPCVTSADTCHVHVRTCIANHENNVLATINHHALHIVCRKRDGVATQFLGSGARYLACGTIDLSHLDTSSESSEEEEEPEPNTNDVVLDDDSDSLPGLVPADTGAMVLNEWSRPGHPICKLLTRIAETPYEHVLDVSWCVEDCEYASGTLQCQRYTLLRRLYQIQCQLGSE